MAASEESIKRFMMAQDRAKKLIQMDVNGGFKQYEQKARESAEMSLNEDSIPQYQSQPQQQTMSYNQEPLNIKTNSKLPKEILESFKTKQIDPSPLGYGVSSSILDEVNYRTQGKLYNEETNTQPQAKPKQQLVENVQIPTNATNVDYSMIKMIVEDCMRKYVSSLKKTIINESKNNNDELQALKIGDKFSFITKNGDLFEAELKFIKNLNNKKG
jgi:hypothetical protein